MYFLQNSIVSLIVQFPFSMPAPPAPMDDDPDVPPPIPIDSILTLIFI